MGRIGFVLGLAFALSLGLTACASPSRGRRGGVGGPPADGETTWTVLVYGHADHNLSNSLVRDMQEMSRARLGDDVKLVVVADWDASQSISDREERFPEGTEWYVIEGGGEPPLLVAQEEEQDLDDPAVLEATIVRAFEENPADRYALILWDHGGAWDGGFGADSQNGTVTDHDAMPVVDLAAAVRSALDTVGLEGDRPLELLSFDTCLMGGAEVAYELRDLAAVYVANAEIDYGDGWDYEGALTWIAEHPDATPAEIAAAEVELWDAHHAEATFSDRVLRSHIAIDTTALDDLAVAVAYVVESWAVSPTVTGVEVGRTAFSVLPPYSKTLEQADATPALRDLGQLLDAIAAGSSDPTVAGAATTARTALASATLGGSHGAIRTIVGQSGLHTEMSPAAFLDRERLDRYAAKAPAWAEATGWLAALEALASMNDGAPPAIEHELTMGDDGGEHAGPTIVFQVQDDDVAQASVDVAIQHPEDPSRVVYFGLAAFGAIAPGETYAFPWDGTLTSIGDGDAAQPVQVARWMDMGVDPSTGEALPQILAIPAILSVPGDESTVQATLLFMDGDAEIELVVLTEQSVSFMLADLARDFPGVQLTPVYSVYDATTGEAVDLAPGTTIDVPASGTIPLTSTRAPAGQYVLMTQATDVWGNTALVADAVAMP